MNVFVLLNTRKIFWRKFVTRLFWGTIDFHSRKKNTMEVNCAPELLCFPHSSEYLPLCWAEQRHAYRLETTWGWVNDDKIFIFEWTIPLRAAQVKWTPCEWGWTMSMVTEYWAIKLHDLQFRNRFSQKQKSYTTAFQPLDHFYEKG